MTKTYTKGKYELTHTRFINDFGFEQDSFQLTDTEARVNMPFTGMLKPSNATKESNLAELHFEYTDEDYEGMIVEQIELYESLPTKKSNNGRNY